MGYSKDQLIARLQELQINFARYDHPVALTVEAQAGYLNGVKGALTKNLFLKDKKHRFYIVSALADTKVDLKVLSQRLGLGKAGLRMAPEEALPEILQVPLGSVTPLALMNDSARCVSLMLDKGFKDAECCFFHPLSNDTTITLKAEDLNKFLKSIGKDAVYVDLEADPKIGKDQPPDLADLVPSDVILLSEDANKTVPSQNTDKTPAPVISKPTAVAAKAGKPTNISAQKEKPANATSILFADPMKVVEDILEKTTALVLKDMKKESLTQHGEQLGDLVSNSIRKHIGSSDLISIANMFKDKAYTEGLYAGSRQQGGFGCQRWNELH